MHSAACIFSLTYSNRQGISHFFKSKISVEFLFYLSMSIYVGLKRTLTEIQYESTQILTTALESAHDRNGLLQGTLM